MSTEEIKPGNEVYIVKYNDQPLEPPDGPYKVIDVIGFNKCILDFGERDNKKYADNVFLASSLILTTNSRILNRYTLLPESGSH